jgi:hypothetical protein
LFAQPDCGPNVSRNATLAISDLSVRGLCNNEALHLAPQDELEMKGNGAMMPVDVQRRSGFQGVEAREKKLKKSPRHAASTIRVFRTRISLTRRFVHFKDCDLIRLLPAGTSGLAFCVGEVRSLTPSTEGEVIVLAPTGH